MSNNNLRAVDSTNFKTDTRILSIDTAERKEFIDDRFFRRRRKKWLSVAIKERKRIIKLEQKHNETISQPKD